MRRIPALSGLPVLRLTALALAVAALGGCSSMSTVVSGKSVDYESAKAAPSLDIPPDLTQITREQRYTMPDNAKTGPVSALAYQKSATVQTAEP
ncbi:MAG: outer membrane protein assembly factor BamC, partial [Thiomonas delicata]